MPLCTFNKDEREFVVLGTPTLSNNGKRNVF